jgi:Cof subfamily protein (haloacid dehalogenase superfamily)
MKGPDKRSSARPARYRAVVLDVDGTMVGTDYVVSARTRRAIAAAKEAGAVVSLATGRMMRSARRFAIESGADGPTICYQGALTFWPASGEIVRHVKVGKRAASEALALFAGAGAHVNLYLDDEVYVEKVTPWTEGYASRMEISLRVTPSLAELASSGPTLILATAEKERIEQLLPDAIAKLAGIGRVTHSLPHFCEVGSPDAGKERAMAHLSQLLGVPRTAFIAFGDGKGDAEMLRWAGLGVAVEGGHLDTLAAAQRVAPGPDADGVATVIEELLRQGRIGP